MADPVQSWIPIDEVKVALDLAASDISQDARLAWVVDGVCRAIEDYCGRTFLAETETELLDGDGEDVILLKSPIISVTTLINDGTTLTVTTDYLVYGTLGKIRLLESAFVDGPQTVSVTYRHGWEADKIPASIKSAAIMWSCKRFLDVKDSRVGVTSVSLGDQTIGYAQSMPTEIQEMVQPYRIIQ